MSGAGITGIATYVPEGRMSPERLGAITGIPVAVVRDKLGLNGRVLPTYEDQPTVMAVKAARLALERAGRTPDDVDVVICITEEHKEYPVWTAGIKLAHDLGAHRAYAFDVGQKCGTSVLALKLARDQLAADPEVDVVLVAGGYRNGDLIDLTDPNVRFMYNLGAGGGALVVERGRGHAIGPAHIVTDGRFSLDVLVPVGGTITPITPGNAGEYRLQVPNPAGMKRRLEELSLANFVTVVREAVRKAGATVEDVAYLAMLHVKPSAHRHLLGTLGIDEERSIYLADYGHLGQVDQILSLELAARRGLLKPGDLVVLVAAGVGYVWNAITLRWGAAGSAGEGPGHGGGTMTYDVASFRAAVTPDRPAVHWDDRWNTYGAMDRRARRLAGRLHALGAHRFDRISILAHNHLAHLDLWLATAKAAVVYAPLNPRLSPVELRAVVDQLRPRLLLHDAAHAAVARGLGVPTVDLEDYEAWLGDAEQGPDPAVGAGGPADDPADRRDHRPPQGRRPPVPPAGRQRRRHRPLVGAARRRPGRPGDAVLPRGHERADDAALPPGRARGADAALRARGVPAARRRPRRDAALHGADHVPDARGAPGLRRHRPGPRALGDLRRRPLPAAAP